MENDEKATFNDIFFRSLTFRKTGHFKNVKNDKSLSLKIFLASTFVIFMFEVPFLAGNCRKYPVTWSILIALIVLICSSTISLILAGTVALCLAVAGRYRQFGFAVIYNILAVSLIQSMHLSCWIHIFLAAVDTFDKRPLNWTTYFPDKFGIWVLYAWLVVFLANILMVLVNLASVRQT